VYDLFFFFFFFCFLVVRGLRTCLYSDRKCLAAGNVRLPPCLYLSLSNGFHWLTNDKWIIISLLSVHVCDAFTCFVFNSRYILFDIRFIININLVASFVLLFNYKAFYFHWRSDFTRRFILSAWIIFSCRILFLL
jgi:hypothetical protein